MGDAKIDEDLAREAARLTSLVHELRERFESYAGGDRPMSPPVSLQRELRETEQRLSAARGELGASDKRASEFEDVGAYDMLQAAMYAAEDRHKATPATLTREEARSRLVALGVEGADVILSSPRAALSLGSMLGPQDDNRIDAILRAHVAHLDRQPAAVPLDLAAMVPTSTEDRAIYETAKAEALAELRAADAAPPEPDAAADGEIMSDGIWTEEKQAQAVAARANGAGLSLESQDAMLAEIGRAWADIELRSQIERPRAAQSPITTTATDREALGRLVREEWIAWARAQPNPEASWLVPWEDMGEPEREVDRRIGERLAREGRAEIEEAHAALDPIVARRDARDEPLLSITERAATATRIALDFAARATPAPLTEAEARAVSDRLARCALDSMPHVAGLSPKQQRQALAVNFNVLLSEALLPSRTELETALSDPDTAEGAAAMLGAGLYQARGDIPDAVRAEKGGRCSVSEPRTTADIMCDMLDFAAEHEWSDDVHAWGDYYEKGCRDCGATKDVKLKNTPCGEHAPGCARYRLFEEARAFLRAEQEPAAAVRPEASPAVQAAIRTGGDREPSAGRRVQTENGDGRILHQGAQVGHWWVRLDSGVEDCLPSGDFQVLP
jgi:hypothetical protein